MDFAQRAQSKYKGENNIDKFKDSFPESVINQIGPNNE